MSQEDIFDEWKRERFIVAEYPDMYKGFIVVLADFMFWARHSDELDAWCEKYGCQVKGMTVEVPDQDTLLLFKLKWM